MPLYQVTAPTTEPVTLSEAKLHLRIDAATQDEDALVTALIQAARETVETYTHRAIPAQTWDEKFDGFPWGPSADLWLSKPPVTSITSVSYLDTQGVTQTWTEGTTGYLTDIPTGPWARRARIYPAYGRVYPPTFPMPVSVTVRFVAGYTAIPEAIKAAMKLLIGHWYQNRESAIVGTTAQELPLAVASLLWPFKAF